jgi:phosphatidylserine/phosphatidylglycerophosphate/cardiolipin synthase-like enzyme
MRFRPLALMLAAFALAACSSTSSTTLPTPPPLQVERTGLITLESIQPDDGIDAVTRFIDEATKSVDIAVYQMDPGYSPLIEALTRAKERGVRVRILLSGTIYPPGSTNDNPRDVEILREQGFEAALSRPEFSFSHWKVLIIDAGTSGAQALICDFNLEAGYFGIDPQYPDEGDTRGMAVLDRDPADVAMIARTFDADWPPYKPWPANARPNLVWSPSDSTCDSTSCASAYPLEPVGNSRDVMLSLIGNAQESLDIYAQALAEPSQLLTPLLDAANRGVKVRIIGNDGGINTDALTKLKDAGAEIVTSPTDPGGDGKVMYIHTKTIVVDAGQPDAIAYVGSINPFLDESIDTERELGVLLTDPTSIERIMLIFDRDFGSGERA